ncbi:MAG: hypothetical protein EOP43_02535 [Sphingobacteriaceae bacterium]|nr:MAG: hypothetical protein EOP43_02535 [Sphingobacteriaceae bacterium]
MTETFTNLFSSAVQKETLIEDADDLDDKQKRIYTLIAAKLNLMQLSPREETIQKILSYSKSRDNF